MIVVLNIDHKYSISSNSIENGNIPMLTRLEADERAISTIDLPFSFNELWNWWINKLIFHMKSGVA